MISNGFVTGDWVLCQNCHLGLPFLRELEDMLVKVDQTAINDEFRLWVTSEPHKAFPIGLLQMSVKLTNEPPQGMAVVHLTWPVWVESSVWALHSTSTSSS